MKYFAYLISFLFLVSCNVGNDPVKYNDTIINPQLEIITKLDYIYEGPEVSVEDIKKQREGLLQDVEKGLKDVKELKDFKGNTAFKDAAMKYFSHVNYFYGKTKNIDSLIYYINSEERAEQMDPKDFDFMDKETAKYLELESNLLAEQKKFAQQFNMRLDY